MVVIYEGGRIPGAAEEGAAAGEVIGEGDQRLNLKTVVQTFKFNVGGTHIEG